MTTTSIIDVLDRVLDKGIVIDAWVRVSVAGIDLVTLEARVVVASFATYMSSAGPIADHLQASRPALEPNRSHDDLVAAWSQAVEDLLHRYQSQNEGRNLGQRQHRRAEDRILEELRDARARIVAPGDGRHSRAAMSRRLRH